MRLYDVTFQVIQNITLKKKIDIGKTFVINISLKYGIKKFCMKRQIFLSEKIIQP